MSPKQTLEKWVAAFNNADVNTLESLYAVNHQMPNKPVVGKNAIVNMFREEFAAAPGMHCIPVQIITENDWAVLEWQDPKGFGGCGFFKVKDRLIEVQRGYWDRLTFNKLYNFQ